jgi:hypothetical protein
MEQLGHLETQLGHLETQLQGLRDDRDKLMGYRSSKVWGLSASFYNSITQGGFRREIIHEAEMASARGEIKYELNDLVCRLQFSSEESAERFKRDILKLCFTVFTDISYKVSSPKPVSVDSGLKKVDLTDYKNIGHNSPPDHTTVSSTKTEARCGEDLRKYQCLESAFNMRDYYMESCHIIDNHLIKSNEHPLDKKFIDNSNNRLAMSKQLHVLYDGYTSSAPKMLIVPVNRDIKLEGINRTRVYLSVTFTSTTVQSVFRREMKADTVEILNPPGFESFVDVEDPVLFKYCILFKSQISIERGFVAWAND